MFLAGRCRSRAVGPFSNHKAYGGETTTSGFSVPPGPAPPVSPSPWLDKVIGPIKLGESQMEECCSPEGDAHLPAQDGQWSVDPIPGAAERLRGLE